MSKLYIKGGHQLKGSVVIDGSKNASLPIIAACCLIKGTSIIKNVPKITDVSNMINILEEIGAKVIRKENILIISNTELSTKIENNYEMRGSYYFIGALLARYNHVESTFPGGCKIGERPIDVHIKAFRDLGYNVSIKDKIIVTGEVKNTDITLSKKSVGATINALLSCLNCKKEVIIRNTLIEPETRDLINFLNKSGFQIEKIVDGIKIIPRTNINPIEYVVMPDRIETMTYVILGLLIGKITIKKANIKNIKGLIDYLILHGAKIKIGKDINVRKSDIKKMNIICDTYPSIPTDLNPLLGVLLLHNNGGIIKDNIFPSRNKSLLELRKVGANITIDKGIVIEPSILRKGELKGYDLRGEMAILLSCLASNKKYIFKMDYINRGYSDVISKLKNLGAKIKKI